MFGAVELAFAAVGLAGTVGAFFSAPELPPQTSRMQAIKIPTPQPHGQRAISLDRLHRLGRLEKRVSIEQGSVCIAPSADASVERSLTDNSVRVRIRHLNYFTCITPCMMTQWPGKVQT